MSGPKRIEGVIERVRRDSPSMAPLPIAKSGPVNTVRRVFNQR